MTKNSKHIISTEEILSLYNERIRYITLALRYVRDSDKAEEIFSQCIFNLMQKKETQYVSNAKAFFSTVIKNRCLDELKKKKREFSLYQEGKNDTILDTDIERLTSQSSREEFSNDFPLLLCNCKEKLPQLCYEVFMAKRLDKMSNKEICDRFSISESRIYYEIQRALKVFRKEFKDYKIFFAVLLLHIFG